MKDLTHFPDTSWLTDHHLEGMGEAKGKGCGWAPRVPQKLLNPLYQTAYDRYELGKYDPSKKPERPAQADFCARVIKPLPTRAQACAAKSQGGDGGSKSPPISAVIAGVAGSVVAVGLIGAYALRRKGRSTDKLDIEQQSSADQCDAKERLLKEGQYGTE
jgi:hypothetical protein